jgi:hypothetical protein
VQAVEGENWKLEAGSYGVNASDAARRVFIEIGNAVRWLGCQRTRLPGAAAYASSGQLENALSPRSASFWCRALVGDECDRIRGFISLLQRLQEIAERVRFVRSMTGGHDVQGISAALEKADVRQRAR